MTQPDLITTPSALAELCADLHGADFIAVDTEFIRERTYYPRLCLVQVAATSAIGCVDVLAIDDLSPLMSILLDHNITKVLHAGRQDLEIFFHLADNVPMPVFDTQIAADLCGLGDQAGLASVAAQLLDVEVDKSHARADWTRRPLPPEQLKYALDDVRHLIPIYEQLQTLLEQSGRMPWLQEDCQTLGRPDLYSVEPDDSWQRIKGIGRLQNTRFHAARLLAAWREKRAIRLDRPRNWVLRDDALLTLAATMPESKQALSNIKGFPRPLMKVAADLLEIVATAMTIDIPSPPMATPLSGAQRAQVGEMMDRVRQIAATLGLSPSMLATRRDITRVVRDEDSPVLHGWRQHTVGEALLELSGRV